MPGSCFDRPWFYPTVIAGLVAGNAFDLFGTYLSQPHFEHESNYLYVTLKPYGLRLNWPMVILGKVVVCLIYDGGLRSFLLLRRRYYPRHPSTFREFLTHFFFGRPLGWFQSLYILPKSLMPGLLSVVVVGSLSGPYFAYLGYGNLANKYGWWRLGGFWAGRYWVGWDSFIWLALVAPWFCWQLWRDFLGVRPSGVPMENGGTA